MNVCQEKSNVKPLQAVQCFAEWCIFPTNVAYQQVENGVYDPSVIGDKQKW